MISAAVVVSHIWLQLLKVEAWMQLFCAPTIYKIGNASEQTATNRWMGCLAGRADLLAQPVDSIRRRFRPAGKCRGKLRNPARIPTLKPRTLLGIAGNP